MVGNEASPFGCAILGIFHEALPLQHRPTVEAVGGELGEDRPEVDLSVSGTAEPSSPLGPRLIGAISARLAVWAEFGILDVEGLDALVVVVNEGEIVERLQHEMGGIVHQGGARMRLDLLEEHLPAIAVVQVLTWVDFVADIDAMRVEIIEDRRPAFR